ncbi:MAG: hypothetical protein K8S14_06525 [Actinomycetia bacterium]|nr:hypothetical protein [Actinomycetes bacterium]
MKTDSSPILIYQTDIYEEGELIRAASVAEYATPQATVQNITMHLIGICKEGEFLEEATCKDFLQVRTEGKRTVSRNLKHRVSVDRIEDPS